MNRLIRTNEPGVRIAVSESCPGQYHVINGVGTPFPVCNCPAALNRKECWHVIAALDEAASPMEEITMTQDEMTTAIAIAEKSNQVVKAETMRLTVASALKGWNDLKQLAKDHISTGYAPKDVRTPEQGALILMKALELDIPVTAAYEFVAVINGRPKLMGQMVDALVSRSGKGYIHVKYSDDKRCTAVGVREGRPPTEITFTIEMAATAQLLKNPSWVTFPADHLRWKAIARVGRVVFADVLSGMDVIDGQGSDIDNQAEASLGDVRVIEGEYSVSTPAEPEAETLPWEEANQPAAEGEFAELPLDESNEDITPNLVELMEEHDVTWGDIAAHLRHGLPADMERKVEVITEWCNDKGTNLDDLIARIGKQKDATPAAAK